MDSIFINNNTAIEDTSCDMSSGRVALLAGYFLVFVIGTLGNAVVLAVLWSYWKTGPMLELLILYLAVFDLLSSILCPLLFSYWIASCHKWSFGIAFCKILPSLVRILSNVSLAFLMTMAFDRYRAICKPFKERFSRHTLHKIALGTLFLCIAWEIPYIYFLDVQHDRCYAFYTNRYDSLPETILLSVRDLAFLFTMTFTTIASYISLRQTDHRHHLSARCGPIIHMIFCMAIVSSVTILPRDLFRLSRDMTFFMNRNSQYSDGGFIINSSLKLLQASNSIWNVFIYAGKHNHFWSDARHLIFRSNSSAPGQHHQRHHESGPRLTPGLTIMNPHHEGCWTPVIKPKNSLVLKQAAI